MKLEGSVAIGKKCLEILQHGGGSSVAIAVVDVHGYKYVMGRKRVQVRN